MDFTNLGHDFEDTNTFQEMTVYDIPYNFNTTVFGSRNEVQKQLQIGLEDDEPIVLSSIFNENSSNSEQLDHTFPIVNAQTSNLVPDPAQTPNEQVQNKKKRTKDPISLEEKREEQKV